MDLTQIQQKLETALPGAAITITDESAHHIEHNPTGAHLAVHVIYEGFRNKTLLEQHKMVNSILQEELKEEIHALRIKTEAE